MRIKEKHIQIMIGHFLRNDELMAARHYTENRISYASFKEAKARSKRIHELSKENNGFLFKPIS